MSESMSKIMELEPKMPICWNRESKPSLFCPGCGYGIVFKELGFVIDELGIQDRVVMGMDIGCSLLGWNFFDCDTVQTHHGRTTPTLVGVKRSNSNLICIGVMGDGGGYAIGAHHLVNTANRNDNVMALLINNANYAMTGGQMAPTTLLGQKTMTTPYGRETGQDGFPLRGAEMVASLVHDDAYVARIHTGKPLVMKKILKQAVQRQINGKGFAFVEVLCNCPTNWHTDENETWDFVEKDLAQYYECKVFVDRVGSEERAK